MSETPLFDELEGIQTDSVTPLFDSLQSLSKEEPLFNAISSVDASIEVEEIKDNIFTRIARREFTSAKQSVSTLLAGVASAERRIVDMADELTKVLEDRFGIPRGGAFEIASNFLKENEKYFESRGIDPTEGTLSAIAYATNKGLGQLAVDLPLIVQIGLPQFMALTGAGEALVNDDSVIRGAVEGLATGLLLHGSLRGISTLPIVERAAASGTIFGIPSLAATLQQPEEERDYSQVAADIMIGIGLSLPGGVNLREGKIWKVHRGIKAEIEKGVQEGKPLEKVIEEVSTSVDKAVEGKAGEQIELFDNVRLLSKETDIPQPSAMKLTPEVVVDKGLQGESSKETVKIAEVEGIDAKTPPDTPTTEAPIKVKKWPSRVKDLARIHAKQRDISDQGQDLSDLKLQMTGKSSMADMTKVEMAKYETEIDRQIGISKTDATAETKTVKQMVNDTKNRTLSSIIKNKIVKSPVGINFGSGIAIVENLGDAGKKLARLSYDTYARRQQIRGYGDNVIRQINKLLPKKDVIKLSAAIDPLFADSVSPEYLARPDVIAARDLWKGFTDRLQAQREKFNTWVLVDGKRIPAEKTYHENWLRRQLTDEARKEFSNGQGSEVYNREVERLILEGRARNIEQAEILIGEWLRRSPIYNGPIRYGSADRPRLVELSPEMYEQNFSKLAPGIIDRYSRFLAAAESFGQDMKIRDKLIGRITIDQDVDLGQFTSDLMRDFIEGQQSTRTRRALQSVNSAISQGQLSFPTSGGNNVLYSNNTDYPTYGNRAFVGGYLGWVDGPFQYRKAIELARKSGQIETGTRELESVGLRGALSKFSPGLMRPTEFLNRTKAVISARIAATQAAKALHGSIPEIVMRIAGGRRPIQSARQFLENFGKFNEAEIDAIGTRGYLTDEEMLRVMSIAPTLTQGSANPLFMPKIARGEFGAPLASLKKMSYRATAGFYNGVIRPTAKGNIGPMIKWAAATAGAGEAMYQINYMLFGWRHPEEDSPLVDRLIRDAMRGNGFGIVNDWFDGYGMMPILVDKSTDVWNDLVALVTGKQTSGQTLDDTMESLLGLYRGSKRLFRAHLHESAPEIRRWQDTRTFVRVFNKSIGRKNVKIDDSFLTERSPFYREIRESFWNGLPSSTGPDRVQQGKEWNLTIWAAYEAILTQYEASGLSKRQSKSKAKSQIKTVISRLKPVNLSEDRRKRFIDSLTDEQSAIVKQAEREYKLRAARKRLIFTKPREVTAFR